MVEAQAAAAVSRHAWAKINLYLEVTGRRADGYHELDSLIVFAGLGDRLDFAPAEDLSLELSGSFAGAAPNGADNLVVRAALALAEQAGRPPRARLRLDKRLPVAAGIGGGSADAAAALEGLAELWRLRPAPADLARMSARLGADVPVCLYGRPALVHGVGEIIERAPPLPPAWLVLVNPGLSLATAQVFQAYEGAFSPPSPWTGVATNARGLAERLAERRNDLEEPARRLTPQIGHVLEQLSAAPGALLARMSGSGATCFGLFAEAGEARAAADEIGARQADWWVSAAPILHGKLAGHWRG